MAPTCPAGPCDQEVDESDWRCPECGKDLVDTKLEKAGADDRPSVGEE